MSPTHLPRFEAHRARLGRVAYRMLGLRGDAEDVVQDAWLRWAGTDLAGVDNDEAWLVSVTTRLCIDRLRSAKVQRDAYPGEWLPEPLVASLDGDPATSAERAGEVSIALLAVLERLTPEERAAFLLRQVFDHDYPDVARILGKTEAACRQLVHRASARVQREQPRFTVAPVDHLDRLRRFAEAAKSGRHDDIMALLAPDVTLTGDGGGRVVSVNRVLVGADRVARLFQVVAKRFGDGVTYELADVNGSPGIVRWLNGEIESVQAVMWSDSGISAIYTMRNPEKLQRIFR